MVRKGCTIDLRLGKEAVIEREGGTLLTFVREGASSNSFNRSGRMKSTTRNC
jgi:hypothetical protein